MSNDIIYRQDAIDAFWKLEAELRPSAIDAVLDMLKNLPSAESERIIRCANCRFFKRNIPCTGGHYNGCEMWLDDGNEIRVMTDDYCSKALPKEGEQDE